MVGAEGWIAFTHDRKFHEELPACAAIKQHNVGCFYLVAVEIPTWDKVQAFMRGYPLIAGAIQQTQKPFIYHLTHNNRLVQVPIP